MKIKQSQRKSHRETMLAFFKIRSNIVNAELDFIFKGLVCFFVVIVVVGEAVVRSVTSP